MAKVLEITKGEELYLKSTLSSVVHKIRKDVFVRKHGTDPPT